MITDVPLALLLAGGASRRFGSPKLNLLLGEETLLQRSVQQLRAVASRFVILTSTAIQLPALPDEVEIHLDQRPFEGPLAALQNFMECEKQLPEKTAVMAADMPYLTSDWISVLLAHATEVDAVVPVADNKPQPLAALYFQSSWEKLRAHSGLKSLRDWLDILRVNYVPATEWPIANLFHNINTQADWRG